MVPNPSAAATDQITASTVLPDAIGKSEERPDVMDVPAIASVAGPGLALAINAACKIKGRLASRTMIVPDVNPAFLRRHGPQWNWRYSEIHSG
ncbi:hypothetical protein [Thioclava sp.]|uniref:hypothetical protein n=1 Tax=Thioclava sp. TaxID=1933450 RepID=UPI003242F0DA